MAIINIIFNNLRNDIFVLYILLKTVTSFKLIHRSKTLRSVFPIIPHSKPKNKN